MQVSFPPEAPGSTRSTPRGVGRAALVPFAVALLALLALVAALHLRLLLRGGGLWRDEVNTLHVATMPSLGELWRALEFESAPVLWPLVLRGTDGPCASLHQVDGKLHFATVSADGADCRVLGGEESVDRAIDLLLRRQAGVIAAV